MWNKNVTTQQKEILDHHVLGTCYNKYMRKYENQVTVYRCFFSYKHDTHFLVKTYG